MKSLEQIKDVELCDVCKDLIREAKYTIVGRDLVVRYYHEECRPPVVIRHMNRNKAQMNGGPLPV